MPDGPGHLQCPYCNSYDITRMYLASLHVDSCECNECAARWDQEPDTGDFRGRGSRESAVTRDR